MAQFCLGVASNYFVSETLRQELFSLGFGSHEVDTDDKHVDVNGSRSLELLNH